MKKMLSILSIISITTITINVIACNKENIKIKQIKLQQPPKNSNWKLVDNPESENLNNNKTYIGIAGGNKNGFYTVDWKKFNWKLYKYKSVYRWDGDGEPQTPTINQETGEIINWNDKLKIIK